MECPYCKKSFPLTWSRYLKSSFDKHMCPYCNKESLLSYSKFHLLLKPFIFSLLFFATYLVLLSITSGKFLSIITAIGITMILHIPIEKFDFGKFRKLKPKEKAVKFYRLKIFIKFLFVSFLFSFPAILYANIFHAKFVLKNTHLAGNVRIKFMDKTFIQFEEEVVQDKEPKYDRILKYFINYLPLCVLVVTQYTNDKMPFNDACKNFLKIDSLKVDEHKFYIMKHKDYITFATNYELKIFLDFEYLLGDLTIEEIKKLLCGINFKLIKKEN